MSLEMISFPIEGDHKTLSNLKIGHSIQPHLYDLRKMREAENYMPRQRQTPKNTQIVYT